MDCYKCLAQDTTEYIVWSEGSVVFRPWFTGLKRLDLRLESRGQIGMLHAFVECEATPLWQQTRTPTRLILAARLFEILYVVLGTDCRLFMIGVVLEALKLRAVEHVPVWVPVCPQRLVVAYTSFFVGDDAFLSL